jgi:HEAT repeat protein
MSKTDKITIKQLQDALLDVDKPLNPRYLYRLSDISNDDLAALQRTWSSVPAWRRQAIMEDIEEIGSSDYVLSFEAFARFGLQDNEPRVRELAVRTLWEYELPDLVPTFIDMMERDEDVDVRAAAATALGQYIYLGEIEELPASKLHKIEEKLLQTTTGQNPTLVRRRALEALGFSSRDELPALIEAAYYSDSNEWLASALFAMGRSANRTWNSSVISKLNSDVPDVLVEAVRAAGELEIKEAVPRLMDLLAVEDADVRWAAIWSLSQIGGEGIRERLEELYDLTDDEEEADFIDSALENLDFTEDISLFDLMDVADEDDDEDDDEGEDFYLDMPEDDEDLKD